MVTEIGLAISAAKTAFNLIKSATETTQQAISLTDQLGSFFDAKEKVEEIKQSKNRGAYSEEESVSAYALRIIEAEAELERMELAIKKQFMAAGRTPQYQKMLRVRTEERDRRELAKRELLKLQREKLKRQQEAKNLIIALFALAMCAGSAIYIAVVAVG